MFLNPLGLLALLGVPVVVAVHLFRRRFRSRKVSAVFLWQEHESSTDAGRTRVPLQRSPSFWLEMLAALVLGLLVAQPTGCSEQDREHLVIVLDGSASMAAIGSQGAVHKEGIKVATRRIRGLGIGARVSLLVSGPSPKVLAGPRARPAEAIAALKDYDPGAPAHDPEPTLKLGADLAEGGAVLFVTDHPDGAAGIPEAETIALGEALPNLAIVQAVRRSEAGVERIFVGVRNLSNTATAAVLQLSTGDEVLVERDLRLEADGEDFVTLRMAPSDQVMKLELAPAEPQLDRLGSDNRAFLAPPPNKQLLLGSTLAPRPSLALGLTRSGEPRSIERWLSLSRPAEQSEENAGAHILIGKPKQGGPRTWLLDFASEGQDRQSFVGPFLIERAHPLLEGITLDGVVWTRTPVLDMPGRPLISVGNEPLLTERIDGNRRIYRFNMDPVRSNLRRSPDWPILLANLADLRRSELPGPNRSNIGVGETFIYRQAPPGDWKVSGPSPKLELQQGVDLIVDGLDRAGVYTLERDADRLFFAANLVDPMESDLRDRGSGEQASAVALASIHSDLSLTETLLFLLALLLLSIDWWFLARMSDRGSARGALID